MLSPINKHQEIFKDLIYPSFQELTNGLARHLHYQIVDNSGKSTETCQQNPNTEDSYFRSTPHSEDPTIQEVTNLITNIYSLAKIETDCVILSLVYINRFQSVSKILMNNSNWIEIIFISCLVSQKMWNKVHLENSDFSNILEGLNLDLVNSMEIDFLNLINYEVEIDAKIYIEHFDKIKENENWSFNAENLKRAVKRSIILYKIEEIDLSKFSTTRMYEIPDFDY